ncbi:sensor histidine kinase [Alicyclobacillus fastidiosus]|uniref:histidine kinase n=1 Tax=Alicyclobacillus fastidiosus TaxID=392011 RepID=A0ABY6ZCQ4_9BACL|nr:sensor histidine kinase [Alicyclobacillus fastidiosus]WAH40323.1 sensor histidine kinase [Alicyclobacillus fastidiosus]GMA61705.1 sensor histidine kinase YfiJ [Alicyclobacillus fastidiosus]
MNESLGKNDASPPLTQRGHRGIWLALRLVAQFSLVVYYTNFPELPWQRAVLAIGTVALVGTNLILIAWRDDRVWRRVERTFILVECGVISLFSAVLLTWTPLGPAVLMALPTLLTYTSLYRIDRWQWLISCVPFVEMVWMIHLDVHWRVAGQFGDAPVAWWFVVCLYAIIILIGTAFAFLLQIQTRERQQLLQAVTQVQEQAKRLEIVNHQLNDYADKVYHLATAEERNRIAGEIHDSVAHRLTALFVQLQAARRIWTQDADRETSLENLVVCEALAREALDEVRTSVRSIRRTEADEGITSLRRLALQFTKLTSMQTSFQVDAALDSLPAEVLAVLYRVVQEALTNAQRHGRATRVHMDLRKAGSGVELVVVDNGKGSAELVFGFGLSSMQQRLQQYGGDIVVESDPGVGFRLVAQLPTWKGAFG